MIPRNDRRYPRLERLALRRLPGLARLYRTGIYWAHEGYVPAFTWQPRLAAPAQRAATANLRKAIKDPALREKVTPHFRLGCKRVLRSNTYYPALAAGERRRRHRSDRARHRRTRSSRPTASSTRST